MVSRSAVASPKPIVVSANHNNYYRMANVQYSFWNFRSQIESRKLYFRYSFWNFRSQIEKRKLEFHYSFWNFRSQFEKPKSTSSQFDLELSKKNFHSPFLELRSQIKERKSELHFSFWNFHPPSQIAMQSCRSRRQDVSGRGWAEHATIMQVGRGNLCGGLRDPPLGGVVGEACSCLPEGHHTPVPSPT